jgi:hypothetical protein
MGTGGPFPGAKARPGLLDSVMNCQVCGKKLSYPNFKVLPGICLEGPRETTENLIQDSQCLGLDLNP